MEVVLAAKVRTELFFGNVSAAVGCPMLVLIAIHVLCATIVIVHRALLLGRALFALLLLGPIGLRLFAVILPSHIRVVVPLAVVGPCGLVFLFAFVIVFRLLLILLVGFIFVAVLAVARSGRDQEQK